MLFNPWVAQRVAEERMKDLLREAEQERLIRKGKRPARTGIGRWIAPLLATSFVVAIVVIRKIV